MRSGVREVPARRRRGPAKHSSASSENQTMAGAVNRPSSSGAAQGSRDTSGRAQRSEARTTSSQSRRVETPKADDERTDRARRADAPDRERRAEADAGSPVRVRPTQEEVERRVQERAARERASTGVVRARLEASVGAATPTSLMTEKVGDGDANCLERAASMARPGRDELVFMDDRRAAGDGNADGAGHVLIRDRASGRVWDPNNGPAPANPRAWTYASVDAWTAAQGPAADRGPAYVAAATVRAEKVQDVLSASPGERAGRIAEIGDPALAQVAGRLYADGPAPATDPAAQARALTTVRTALDDSGFFDRVTRGELATAAAAIAGLDGPDAAAVIRQLDEEGLLDKLTRTLDARGAEDLAQELGQALGEGLDGRTLATVAQSMRGASEDTRAAFIAGMNGTASPATKVAFVEAMAGATTDGTPSPAEFEAHFGSATSTGFLSDGDAVSVASVISTLRGEDAAAALGQLSEAERAAVFAGAANLRNEVLSARYASTQFREADAAGYTALMDAVASIPDPEVRGRYLSEGLAALGELQDAGVPGRQTSAMASSVVQDLDGETLNRISPDAMAALAGGLAATPGGPIDALRTINGLEASPAREALVRTLFLKTPERAFRDSPELVDEVSRALAAGEGGDDPAVTAERAQALREALSTDEGRALLVDERVPGAARLWAARELMNGAEAVGGSLQHDPPWESHALLERYAETRFEQFAVRGDEAVAVSGQNIENLIGAGLGLSLREDLPQDEAGLAAAQAEALDGNYNFYAGNETVDRVATGIRIAQERMGGGEIRVATLPVQFSSQATGPVDLQIYRIEGADGQERFVDNTGRVYDSFERWRTGNELPPGKMTYPAGGHLGPPGETGMVTENTPDVSDSFWEHVEDVADVAALAGGVVASGIIIAGSGGTATPLVMGAWGVALGSAGYMGVKAGMELYDRHQHGQTLSLTDPDARAAWLSLGGAGLTVLGAGVAQGAAALTSSGSRLAPTVARAAGILNASANFADAAATVDQANALITNWDRLSPAERAQMGLSIAFWGGMTGVSTRASGGRVTDAFSFSAQMNRALIESGAAVRVNPELPAGHARVYTGYTEGGRLNLSVEHGPGTSQTSIDIHKQVAHTLIDNAGIQGALRRTFGDGFEFRPGTRGEEVALEVAKHRALVQAYDERIPGAPPAEQAALRAERDAYAAELARYEGTLRNLRADPALANAPGRGFVAAAPQVTTTGTPTREQQRLNRLLANVHDRAETGFRRSGNYHGDTIHQMPDEVVRLILREPDAIYQSTGGAGRLIYVRGGDIAIVEGPGSAGGNVVTAYGPSGVLGPTGAAATGGNPTDPGQPITDTMITSGTIPVAAGNAPIPPATLIWSR